MRKGKSDLYGVIEVALRKRSQISPNSHQSLKPVVTQASFTVLAFKRHQQVKYGMKAGIIGGDWPLTTTPQ